jgi:predicted nucleic acid-binding protein
LEYKRIALDTDILIDILRKNTRVTKEIEKLEDKPVIFATTVVNSFELFYGAYKSQKKKNIELVKKLLSRLNVLNWFDSYSQDIGKNYSDLEKLGQKIDYRDLFIGIIVLKNDYHLFTRNLKHFERIPNLKILEFNY